MIQGIAAGRREGWRGGGDRAGVRPAGSRRGGAGRRKCARRCLRSRPTSRPSARARYLVSLTPYSEVERVVDWAMKDGVTRFAMLGPDNANGRTIEQALRQEVTERGGSGRQRRILRSRATPRRRSRRAARRAVIEAQNRSLSQQGGGADPRERRAAALGRARCFARSPTRRRAKCASSARASGTIRMCGASRRSMAAPSRRPIRRRCRISRSATRQIYGEAAAAAGELRL